MYEMWISGAMLLTMVEVCTSKGSQTRIVDRQGSRLGTDDSAY